MNLKDTLERRDAALRIKAAWNELDSALGDYGCKYDEPVLCECAEMLGNVYNKYALPEVYTAQEAAKLSEALYDMAIGAYRFHSPVIKNSGVWA